MNAGLLQNLLNILKKTKNCQNQGLTNVFFGNFKKERLQNIYSTVTTTMVYNDVSEAALVVCSGGNGASTKAIGIVQTRGAGILDGNEGRAWTIERLVVDTG